MPKHHIFALCAVVAVVGCTGTEPSPTTLTSGPPEEPTTVTTAREPTSAATSTTTAEPTEPTTTATTPKEGDLEWAADPLARYAAVEGDRIVVEGEERSETGDLSDVPTGGGFVDDVLYFSLGCCAGVWQWDYSRSDETVPVVGAENEGQTVLHGVASSGEQQGFFYTAGGDQPGDIPDLMFYDVATGEAEEFFSEAERRPGLTEEEQTAAVGKVVTTEDLVGVLLAFGDSTWMEWYTDRGEPTEIPFGEIGEAGTILDMALAPDGDTLVLGMEEELNQGIAALDVVATDGTVVSYSVPEGQSLRNLAFDGRYVTASVHEIDEAATGHTSPAGGVVLDIERGDFRYFAGPPILALEGSP